MIRNSFKDLKIWQKAMVLAKLVYSLEDSFPKKELFGLTNQMQRAAISIPSNIAEGSQRVSDKEFAKFILIAKGSLAELETQILLAKDFGYIKDADLSKVVIDILELDKMLFSFFKKLKANS